MLMHTQGRAEGRLQRRDHKKSHLNSVKGVQTQVVDEVRGCGDLLRINVLEVFHDIHHARRNFLLRQEST